MDLDERFMQRALDLARIPPFTLPNPRVGAVVVRDGIVLGQGAHEGPGTPHAERRALQAIDSATASRESRSGAAGATIYLVLEPCVHRGRTPPCAPMLREAGITRAVIAIEDPDERVRGRGTRYLRDNGIEVDVGVLAEQARVVNRQYLHHRVSGRPFVTLKLALTIDGRLAAPDGSSRWITGAGARRLVHARRLEADAVLVGADTVIADDPRLTVREVPAARQPIRVVVDSSGRVSPGARLFSDESFTIVATTERAPHEAQLALKEAGAEVLVLPADEDGLVDLDALLSALGRRGVAEIYCEGGALLASSLLKLNLVQGLEIHRGVVVTGGGPSMSDLGISSLQEAPRWRLISSRPVGDDVVSTYERAR
jgi:diaminohydroxyphosphoribosylaminopyrimidine deaminase / 5-amino-6-(5-phosphoribosylamino)uracil reductase